jgi:putative membrane protein
MFKDPWLSDEARTKVRDRIVAIEKQTGAEVVVTVGLSSGHYRHADAFFGALCSLAMLLFYLLFPEPLADDVSLAMVVLSYPLGMLLCPAIPGLRRLLLRKRLLRANLQREARSRFVDQGISRTRARSGVLIYVSRFERGAEVVADIGIPVDAIGTPWKEATAALDLAARRGGVPAFLEAMDKLGELLAASVPRAADDVNELPDEVAT